MPTLHTNRQILLVRRPKGMPVLEDFAIADGPLPEPLDGEVPVRTIWLSLDPCMRGRMSDAPSYVPPVALGAVMEGECVGQVQASRAPGLVPGDHVRGHGGWQSWFALPADRLTRLNPQQAPLSTSLGVLGMPGLMAYAAPQTIASPAAGETVVVGSASGAVGAPSQASLPSSAAAAWSARPAVRTSAAMLRRSWASTFASTAISRTSPAARRRHAQAGSTSMSSWSAATCSGPCCRFSTCTPGSP